MSSLGPNVPERAIDDRFVRWKVNVNEALYRVWGDSTLTQRMEPQFPALASRHRG